MLLSGSVGRNGVNHDKDVQIVQVLLNDWRSKKRLGPSVAELCYPPMHGLHLSFLLNATGQKFDHD